MRGLEWLMPVLWMVEVDWWFSAKIDVLLNMRNCNMCEIPEKNVFVLQVCWSYKHLKSTSL
jgi:hypothetical protein